MLSFLAFLLTIGILVIIHEYGHYIFARLLGVKVLVFSVGFGPQIFSFRTRSNEWRLGAIPFGGYVKMLDEREGVVSSDMKHMTFNNKPPYQKILIALAGPLFNLIFAILIYYIIAINGTQEIKPVISGTNSILLQNTIKSQISAPSQIIAINGHIPVSWGDANSKFHKAMIDGKEVVLELKSLSGLSKIESVVIDTDVLNQHFNSDVYLDTIGLYPIAYQKVIGYVELGSVAQVSGLIVNDEILSINKTPIHDWFQAADIIRDSPGVVLDLVVKRHNQEHKIRLTPKSVMDNSGHPSGRIGIMPEIDQNLIKQNTFLMKYGYIAAVNYAFSECYNVVKFNLSSIYKMLTGEISAHDLGGPITIAKFGGIALHDGIINFAEFLALISIGLAIMNLLPIPVLDGGHILMYMIELIVGKQLSESVQSFIFRLGFVLVLGISFFAIYNDIMRL